MVTRMKGPVKGFRVEVDVILFIMIIQEKRKSGFID